MAMSKEPDQYDAIKAVLSTGRNWGRWGADDQRGAPNLINPEKRRAAARLVELGLSVSLSRPFPTVPAANNPRPAQHFLRVDDKMATDFLGIEFHGQASTHIDALCHVFDVDGNIWNGKPASDVIDVSGSSWAGIEQWSDGLVTRGVLIDVPGYRGTDYVSYDEPVTDVELNNAVAKQNISLSPGDALVIYSGRDKWDDANTLAWGCDRTADGQIKRPGLDPLCARFVRESDCAVLAWDMMDAMPHPLGGIPWNVHGIIYAFGVALIDNCELGELAKLCRAHNRYEFMFVTAPLTVPRATGSPVNPLAIL
jgi:kynurenine formamidase